MHWPQESWVLLGLVHYFPPHACSGRLVYAYYWKYEEDDIALPLRSSKSSSRNQGVNKSLKYHQPVPR